MVTTDLNPKRVPARLEGITPFGEPSAEMVAVGVAALNPQTSDEHRVLPDEEIVSKLWGAMNAAQSGTRNHTKMRRSQK
jgi:hypothetical protein